MRYKRAYNMTGWTITFIVLMAVIAMVRTTLKRELSAKVNGTSDFIFWEIWDDAPEDRPLNELTHKSRTVVRDALTSQRIETKKTLTDDEASAAFGGFADNDGYLTENKGLTFSDTRQRQEKSVSLYVEKGSEALLGEGAEMGDLSRTGFDFTPEEFTDSQAARELRN